MEEKKAEQEQTPTIEPPISSGSTMPKWIMISAVVVLIVIISSAVAYLIGKNVASNVNSTKNMASPTPTSISQPVTSWKTYTNTKHNYSINYPSDWSVREFPDSKDGASFNPIDKPGYPDKSDAISISVGVKNGDYINDPLEDYAKVAASKEIQDYEKLASIKTITTTSGMVGYETTWMVQPFLGRGSGLSESLPITYFELPGNKAVLMRINLDKEENLSIYEDMLKTIQIVTPTVDEEALVITAVREAIIAKSSSIVESLDVTVSQIDGNYAKGSVSDQGGGGMWFAAKADDGTWKLVWDGNGVILCSDLTLYPDFPTSMIPGCYDESTQDTVTR
ncbi:MAG: hypothetical protein NUV52_04585 [Candidatus Roizmanbacteria bacterium]|nr:hypothetical protein [Candidatus Roizmanbacteria bacterium]